ncbi:MAG: hypothetical protein Devi2KO_11610 [Devosia indica]
MEGCSARPPLGHPLSATDHKTGNRHELSPTDPQTMAARDCPMPGCPSRHWSLQAALTREE